MGAVGYATTPRAIWTLFDEREVSADGRLVYMAVRSGPDSTLVPGLVATGLGKLHDATRVPVGRVKRALAELERTGFVEVDWSRGMVLDLEGIAAQYKIGSGSLIRGWMKVWSKLPRSPLLATFIERVSARCDLSSVDVVAALRQVAAAHSVEWGPSTAPPASSDGGPSPRTLPGDPPRGPSTGTLPPDPPGGPSPGTVNGDPPPGPSRGTLPGDPPAPLAYVRDNARDSEQRTAREANTHTAHVDGPPAAPPRLSVAEEAQAFKAAWASFYDIVPDDSDDAAFMRSWVRVSGTAAIRKLDPFEYGRTLMRAFQEWGRSFTNGHAWGASPALFDKHFPAIVGWAEGNRPKAKAAPNGPVPTAPPVRHGSTRLADEDPAVVDRARQLEQQAVARRAERTAS